MYIDDGVFHWVETLIDTPIGKVRKIKTFLELKDKIDDWKARWGINRNNYKVSPGLYAVGNPSDSSPVVVTANYKLTFDLLRKELSNLDLWLMVIDTKGINVWCAAGKGTFGTEEIINRINKVQLNKIVNHNKIILPQLGAPGVAAHIVTKRTGFRVIYGPIRAIDIKEFISGGFKGTEEMRKVKFTFRDRLVLTPIELTYSFKYLPYVFIFFLLYNLVNPVQLGFEVIKTSFYNTLPYIGSLFIGSFLFPLLLPYLPFKAFSLKGLILGVGWSLIYWYLNVTFLFPGSILIIAGNSLIITSIITYLALNFTGSTTYTSLSGVQKETLWTLPLSAIASIIGVILLISYKFVQFMG